MNTDQVVKLTERFGNLKSLKVEHSPYLVISKKLIATISPYLEIFNVQSAYYYKGRPGVHERNDGAIVDLLRKCKGLKELNLSNAYFSSHDYNLSRDIENGSFIDLLPVSLEKLALRNVSLSTDQWISILKKCPNLKSLSFVLGYSDKQLSFEEVAPFFPEGLEELKLVQVPGFTSSALYTIVRRCVLLEKVTFLNTCFSIRDVLDFQAKNPDKKIEFNEIAGFYTDTLC